MFSPTTRRGFLGRASAFAAGAFGVLADPFGIVGHSSPGTNRVRPGEPHPAALKLPKVGPPILEQIGGGRCRPGTRKQSPRRRRPHRSGTLGAPRDACREVRSVGSRGALWSSTLGG